MSDDAIIRSMPNTSDEELLAITSGAALGYTDQARAIAERVLRERRVRLPADLKDLRKRAATGEAEANRRMAELDAVRDRAVGRVWGIRLIVIGVGGFILPIFGWQFRVLMPFGLAIPLLRPLSRSLDTFPLCDQAGMHQRCRRLTNAEAT